jgi:uncharacterized protein (DUF362 family)
MHGAALDTVVLLRRMEKNEIYVIYGKDIAAMAIRLANEANLADLIGDRGKRVGLKPNLVTAKPASDGATTHPEIAAGLILYLKKNGFNNLAILEGSWTGGSTAQAFKVCGYRKLADETGGELIDTKHDKTKTCDCGGMKLEICESALSVDFMINLPVMKGHCQTRLTCALKNNKGIIPDREKSRFHTLGLTKPIARLNTVARNDFIVVDGICGDPDFELGGHPLYRGLLFAARDPVLCDAWAAAQMGYSLEAIPYIGLAEKLGIGSADLRAATVRELDGEKATSSAVAAPAACEPGDKVRRLAPYINEDNACSACYASLVFALSRINLSLLDRLKEKICVGQGFKGKQGNIGIGQCCAAFKLFCSGCPPGGAEVFAFLKQYL